MSTGKNILDNPEKKVELKKAFKNRAPRDLMIVIGVIFSILSVYFLYVFVESVNDFRENVKVHIRIAYNDFYLKRLIADFLVLFYGIALIIGGIGMIRLRKTGWIFGLAVAIFPICVVLISVIRMLINNTRSWSGLMWVAFFIVLFFGLITAFLLSKPIRSYFKPTKKDYGICAFIVIVLTVYLLTIPLMY